MANRSKPAKLFFSHIEAVLADELGYTLQISKKIPIAVWSVELL
jgi:hypothetical protein